MIQLLTDSAADLTAQELQALQITVIPLGVHFGADAYLDGLDKLAKLGVTWVSVHLPGDSMAHALETLDRFRTLVVDAA